MASPAVAPGAPTPGAPAPGAPASLVGASPTPDGWWDQVRWAAVLDRMEHRQVGVGLRFWGPPLWLEVTMNGPDSDAWSTASAAGDDDRSWDWQAEQGCAGAEGLVADGADDGTLLDLASRYTLENLVLNATHEVGEWLRFDARRLFAAHLPAAGAEERTLGPGRQGNGAVRVTLAFGAPGPAGQVVPAGPDPSGHPAGSAGAAGSAGSAGPGGSGAAVARRARSIVASWRFSFLPGTEIGLEDRGPEVRGACSWATAWSPATMAALNWDDGPFVAAVQRDVHRLLLRAEVHRICQAFHVDGRAPWYLRPEDAVEAALVPTARPGRSEGGSTAPVPVTLVVLAPG